MDDEEEYEVENVVLAPMAFTRWNVLAQVANFAGVSFVNVGNFCGIIAAMLAAQGEAIEERKAFAAAVATEIETLTGE